MMRLSYLSTTTAALVFVAADAYAKPSSPVEYVRICSTEGKGFFYIPGTDTCLRVGGRVRYSYQFTSGRAVTPNIFTGPFGGVNNFANGDRSSFQGLAFLNFDARSRTSHGTLRTFIRLITAYSSGPSLASGTNARAGFAYWGIGQDTYGRAQTLIQLDKAFVQFAGFTAGRAGSFFDFYAHDLEHIGATTSSDVASTNLLAYTGTFGGGWSATLSVEDPISRRQPLYANQTFGTTGVGSALGAAGALASVGGTFTQSVPYFSNGTLRVANYDVVQRQAVPDIVAAIRYDAPWGSAQFSAATHEIRIGSLVSTQAAAIGSNGLIAPAGVAEQGAASLPIGLPGRVRSEIGWAVQGGVKVNLPQIATGDVLWLQAAYSEGGLSYVGTPMRSLGGLNQTNTASRLGLGTVDAFIGSDGRLKLTEAWSLTAAFLHYWSPEWRSGVFGSYSSVSFGAGARTGRGPANLLAANSTGANTLGFNTTLRDYSTWTLGTNIIWSPVRDLDVGVEVAYIRNELRNGRAVDGNTGSLGTVGGVPFRTTNSDDIVMARMRVQRDF